MTSMAMTPFFVENVRELQLCSIKLVFARYKKHRQLILEEVFTSLARLPTSKRSLRHFRVNSSGVGTEPLYIQMVSALVLQLIQSVVQLRSQTHPEKADEDELITGSYEAAMRTSQNFLLVFLKKCGSKQGEEDYRPVFENFVQDLLTVLNQPEWPAAEGSARPAGETAVVLHVYQFSTKQTEMALRVASLDYLGTIPGSRDETLRLQKALLNYLEDNGERDSFARSFYIAQWLRDSTTETQKAAELPDSAPDIVRRAERRKKFLRKVARTPASQDITPSTSPDTVAYEDACLIVRHLASTRPFAKSFNLYLTQILRVLGESAIAVRTKAMKCLSEVVAVDPSILTRSDMRRGVHGRLMDSSTSVREAAVELDTGVSVRKRVIKVLRDVCLEQPDFPRTTDTCVRMIRRKLVNETFQKMWFTPTPSHRTKAITRKITVITDVLLKSEEDASYKPATQACVQLVIRLLVSDHESGEDPEHLISSLAALYLFTKTRPQLLVKHAVVLQPYLATKCHGEKDYMVVCNVAKILELVVQHCVSCLGTLVNRLTHSYMFVWACFNRYYGALIRLKLLHQEAPEGSAMGSQHAALLRALLTVGALCRHFDFDQEHFKGPHNKMVIKDKVLDLLLHFTTHQEEEVQAKAIMALGSLFIMHPGLMFVPEVRALYTGVLSDSGGPGVTLKVQVLKNLQSYLQEEDSRMLEADRHWKKLSQQEDLKEMGDISSGMSSSIMQLYLRPVLDAFLHPEPSVRHYALGGVVLTLSQGLVHPVQCLPYLIAMGTDPDPAMRNKADQQLVDIDKKYSGFIHMKAVAGMKMAYRLQRALTLTTPLPVPVPVPVPVLRGVRAEDPGCPALCAHLYSMKTEVNLLLFVADNLACFPYQTQEEPLFIMHHVDVTLSVSGSNLLQAFKESLRKNPAGKKKKKKKKKDPPQEKKKPRLGAEEENDDDDGDNRRSSHPRGGDDDEEEEEAESSPQPPDADSDSDSDSDLEDVEAVMLRLPDDGGPLLEFSSGSQGMVLLLALKQHLKALYGFSDRKSGVTFDPRQTLDFLQAGLDRSDLSCQVKRNIVKQFLDFKLLMEHLDRDDEDEEANAGARNQVISALLGGSGPAPTPGRPRPHHRAALVEADAPDTEEEEAPASRRRPKPPGDTAAAVAMPLRPPVELLDLVAVCCPGSRKEERPQIGRVIQKTGDGGGYTVHWMSGSYGGPWAESRRRDPGGRGGGAKLVPRTGSVREEDIIYRKIALTSGRKLSSRVVQALRGLYAEKDGKKK
ncbi:hypothetical protein CRUP_020635 [Coryphaenoides rupestris]|nr:hypothetical protein CRUP_020635 [Coryphaenoides rupestris]